MCLFFSFVGSKFVEWGRCRGLSLVGAGFTEMEKRICAKELPGVCVDWE